jgi:hypothetical protein
LGDLDVHLHHAGIDHAGEHVCRTASPPLPTERDSPPREKDGKKRSGMGQPAISPPIFPLYGSSRGLLHNRG